MKKWLWEYDTGCRFGPASEEAVEKYRAALEKGRPFFMYPYHGYELRMVVAEVPDEILSSSLPLRSVQKEKAPG